MKNIATSLFATAIIMAPTALLAYLTWLHLSREYALYKCAEQHNVFRCKFEAVPVHRDILPPPAELEEEGA